jgi:hypothetical protein
MAVFRYHISRMYSLPLTPDKTKRMGINTTNSQKQQLSTKSTTEIKPVKYNTKPYMLKPNVDTTKNLEDFYLL